MIQTKHFEISFWEDNADYGAKISTMIEDVYSQIITTFALSDTKETFRFVLCRDVPEYLRETGKTVDDYELHIALDALGDPNDINICLAEGIAVFYANQVDRNEIDRDDPPLFWSIYEEAGFYEFGGYQFMCGTCSTTMAQTCSKRYIPEKTISIRI